MSERFVRCLACSEPRSYVREATTKAVHALALIVDPADDAWSALLAALNLARVADDPLPLLATAREIELALVGHTHTTGPLLALT